MIRLLAMACALATPTPPPVLTAASPAPVLSPGGCHSPAGDGVGWIPKEILEKPATLHTGIGAVHETVSTKNKQAQAFYDQGLSYLHDYVWIESGRSFTQALRLDSNLAMAHAGLSRVYVNLEDKPAARASLERARARSGKASPGEVRRIAALASQLDAIEDPADPVKFAAYKKSLDEALAASPKDVELLLLRGNAEEFLPSGRGQMGGPDSIDWYQKALAASPGKDHPAAHHYLVHSFENVGRIDDALAHGKAFARLAPNVPHAHHMYGHDLRRVGRTREAIAEFEKADALELAYYAAEKIPPALDWHRPHNLHLLATSYQHQGRMKEAEKTIRAAMELKPVTEWHEFNRKELAAFLLARGRDAEALEAANSLSKGDWPAARAMGHVLAGEALVSLKKPEDAGKRLAEAKRELDAVTGDFTPLWHAYLAPYLQGLEGRILLAGGAREKGTALLVDVQAQLRALPGPDSWVQALFELERMARGAREANDWELAERTAAQMREHDAAYGGTWYALALVARHKGDEPGAKRALAEAKKRWPQADPGLPELKE